MLRSSKRHPVNFGYAIVALLIMLIPCVSAADKLPTSAAAIIEQAKLDCNSLENGAFQSTDKAVVHYDFNGDGTNEALVDGAQFSCSTALTLWGGTGGTFLWVIAPDKTYEFLAHKWKVVDVDGQKVLLLAVHSSQCSDDIGPCFRAFVWQDGFRTTRDGIE